MEKNIKDYLHYYLGCQVQHPALRNTRKLTGRWLQSLLDKGLEVKPILRKLESMTDEEAIELFDIIGKGPRLSDEAKAHEVKEQICTHRFFNGVTNMSGRDWAKVFKLLLSKGFDLFNLIESGLAIEKQPTTQNQGV